MIEATQCTLHHCIEHSRFSNVQSHLSFGHYNLEFLGNHRKQLLVSIASEILLMATAQNQATIGKFA